MTQAEQLHPGTPDHDDEDTLALICYGPVCGPCGSVHASIADSERCLRDHRRAVAGLPGTAYSDRTAHYADCGAPHAHPCRCVRRAGQRAQQPPCAACGEDWDAEGYCSNENCVYARATLTD